MTEYEIIDDLMHDNPGPLSGESIRHSADRSLFIGEFAVAYQEPIDVDPGRGSITVWVRDLGRDAPYRRKQAMSGDDRMIRGYLEEMAFSGAERIDRFIEHL